MTPVKHGQPAGVAISKNFYEQALKSYGKNPMQRASFSIQINFSSEPSFSVVGKSCYSKQLHTYNHTEGHLKGQH